MLAEVDSGPGIGHVAGALGIITRCGVITEDAPVQDLDVRLEVFVRFAAGPG
jgi:hypothetical protein